MSDHLHDRMVGIVRRKYYCIYASDSYIPNIAFILCGFVMIDSSGATIGLAIFNLAFKNLHMVNLGKTAFIPAVVTSTRH